MLKRIVNALESIADSQKIIAEIMQEIQSTQQKQMATALEETRNAPMKALKMFQSLEGMEMLQSLLGGGKEDGK